MTMINVSAYTRYVSGPYGADLFQKKMEHEFLMREDHAQWKLRRGSAGVARYVLLFLVCIKQ
jgi:hypothetical protein